ncbi:MAG: hypothetical protein ABEJ30_01050 [Halorientalis sp.]
MYLSDADILEELADMPHGSPRDLADGRYRENVVRLQLRDLARIGAVRERTHDTFELTARGTDIRRDAVSIPATRGLFEIEWVASETVPDDEWRMTDFSKLDGGTVKQLNRDIVSDTAEDYGWVRADPDLTKRRIENVPDVEVDRLIREFPTGEPLPQQCAHWLRAFAGLHWFPDANHRTGMNALSVPYRTLTGSPLPAASGVERTVLESKLSRHLLSGVRFDTLWKRDTLYLVWHRYFRRLLCDDGRRRHEPPDAHLRAVLREARRRR